MKDFLQTGLEPVMDQPCSSPVLALLQDLGRTEPAAANSARSGLAGLGAPGARAPRRHWRESTPATNYRGSYHRPTAYPTLAAGPAAPTRPLPSTHAPGLGMPIASPYTRGVPASPPRPSRPPPRTSPATMPDSACIYVSPAAPRRSTSFRRPSPSIRGRRRVCPEREVKLGAGFPWASGLCATQATCIVHDEGLQRLRLPPDVSATTQSRERPACWLARTLRRSGWPAVGGGRTKHMLATLFLMKPEHPGGPSSV
jgi:hypothetical protein